MLLVLDAVDWCRENDIVASIFLRYQKAAADQISAANYGHLESAQPKQDIVPIDMAQDHISKQSAASQRQNPYLDNPYTIEIERKDVTIRIRNDVDQVLLTRIFHLLQEFSC